jgi:putative transposase
MECKTVEVKVHKSSLSKVIQDHLRMVFIEAKWMYNDMVTCEAGIFDYDYKTETVRVLNRDRKYEMRSIIHLSSHMRQGIIDQAKANIRTLSTVKKKGNRVGILKPVRVINSVSLQQFGTKDIYKNDYVRLQGLKKLLKVRGLRQIPRDAEVSCAKFVRKNGDYYFKIVCYLSKVKRQNTGKSIGLDLGLSTTITTSEGKKMNAKVSKTKRLKQLQKKASKKIKKSKRRRKVFDKYNKEQERMTNKKNDTRHKMVHELVKDYDFISVQDDSIKSWQRGGHGRAVEESCLGGIILDLKRKAKTLIQVNRYFPSTKTCNKCKHVGPSLDLKQRTFVCEKCGHTDDRDVNAAKNDLDEGLRLYALRDAGKRSLSDEPLPEKSHSRQVHRDEAMSCT